MNKVGYFGKRSIQARTVNLVRDNIDRTYTMEDYLDIVKSELQQHGYRFIKFLGKGGYARVVLAEILPDKLDLFKADANQTGNACVQSVAIKVMDKQYVSQGFLDVYLPRELMNHSKLHSHTHVVRIYETMQTQENAYIVMDYCPNGDLVDYINKHNRGDKRGLGESEAKRLFKQLCEAVHHMHSAGIVHRDLKCENILLDKDHNIQLTDFGFSRRCNEMNPMMKTRCGTFSYSAPEVMSGNYNGYQCDIWSLGVTLFSMVNGRLPYNHAQLSLMDEEMQTQRLKFQPNVSSGFITLVKKMLQFSPNNRPSIKQVLGDPWLFGEKPIPRQKLSRPKWETQSAPKFPEALPKVSANNAAGRTPDRRLHPASKKRTGSNKRRTAIGTVSLNRTAGETVTLKSPLHCNKPNKMPPTPKPTTPKPTTTKSSRPVQAARTGQRAKVTKTRQSMDANHVVQAIMDRKIQLEDVCSANGARLTEMKQMPFWLIKEVMESHQQDSQYGRTAKLEDLPAVPNQPITSRVGRKKSHEVSTLTTVGKDTAAIPKRPQASPLCKDKLQQRVHRSSLKPGADHLPTKAKVPHPPHKDHVVHPIAKANEPYQLPKLGVRLPPSMLNITAEPPKPSVRRLHIPNPPPQHNVQQKLPTPSVRRSHIPNPPPQHNVQQKSPTPSVRHSHIPNPPPQHNVQQKSPTPRIPHLPATSRPAVHQQRRVIVPNEDKKIDHNLRPGMSKTHNMARSVGKSTCSSKEAIIQPCQKDIHGVTNRMKPEFQLQRNEFKQRTANHHNIHLAEQSKGCRGRVARR